MKMRMLFLGLSLLVVSRAGAVAQAQAQQPWPNLETLRQYPNPEGNSCPVTGRASATAEKKRTNTLKNRYKLPANGFESLLLSQLMTIPSGTVAAPPDSSDPNQKRAVTVVGYVRKVTAGGSAGESCNCGATRSDLLDSHIEIVLNPNNMGAAGRGVVVVEITERVRRLARSGFLQSNIGNDWSLAMLRARLQGRWVKFSGYLFYDADHHTETWQVDPQNRIGNPNWRQTSWEVHPVLALETNVAPPADAERMMTGESNAPQDTDHLPIIGNRQSRIYHLPTCPGYRRVGRAQRVRFRTEAAARAVGYRRARTCP
ncbi:MAG: hypothetical protein U0Y68_21245 [Blastocatellia bacterium]